MHLLHRIIRPIPAIAQILRLKGLLNYASFFDSMSAGIAVRTVRTFCKKIPRSVVAFAPSFHARQAYSVWFTSF